MKKKLSPLILSILALGGVALAWWLFSPLFIDQTVEEALPFEIPAESELAEMSPDAAERPALKVLNCAVKLYQRSFPLPSITAELTPVFRLADLMLLPVQTGYKAVVAATALMDAGERPSSIWLLQLLSQLPLCLLT